MTNTFSKKTITSKDMQKIEYLLNFHRIIFDELDLDLHSPNGEYNKLIKVDDRIAGKRYVWIRKGGFPKHMEFDATVKELTESHSNIFDCSNKIAEIETISVNLIELNQLVVDDLPF